MQVNGSFEIRGVMNYKAHLSDAKKNKMVSSLFKLETMQLKEGIEAQTHQVLNNLQTILEGAYYQITRIIYLIDMVYFQTVNGIYGAFMDEYKQAHVAITVHQLPMNAVVEIDAIVANLKPVSKLFFSRLS
mgnify:CR=1 FL=1